MNFPWGKLMAGAVGLFLVLRTGAATFYVDINSANPTPPYADLTTAAVSIQTAVDAATNGDLILVNDGVYQDGFRVTNESITKGSPPIPSTISVTNRLVVAKALTVQSINGPSTVFINGGGIYRCVYLTNNAVLSGFTLQNGVAGWISTTQTFRGNFVTVTNAINGGGVAGATVLGSSSVWLSNCVLNANMAYGYGGGAYGVHLVNCTLTGNTAISGGGAYDTALINCMVTGNSARTNETSNSDPFFSSVQPGVGGGIYDCSAVNCVIENNAAYEGGGVYNPTGLNNCTIVNNSAASYGGLHLNGVSYSPYNSATNCIIYYNTASRKLCRYNDH